MVDRKSRLVLALVMATAPGASIAIPTCPEPPNDIVACTMPNGCPGESYCTGRGTWTPCTCTAYEGQVVPCNQTVSSNGCSKKTEGTTTCTATCGGTCTGTWISTKAEFKARATGTGYGAFATIECGDSPSGTCPFKDPNGSSYNTLVNARKDTITETKNSGAGCANNSSCRFSADPSLHRVTVTLDPRDDHFTAFGGSEPRNEFSAFKEQCSQATFWGESPARYYSMSVYVPSTSKWGTIWPTCDKCLVPCPGD